MAAPVPQLDVRMDDLRRLVERTRQTTLTDDEYATLKAAVETLGYVADLLEQKGTSIANLRQLLFGATTENARQVLAQAGLVDATTATAPLANEPSQDAHLPRDRRASGHGRHGAEAYAGGRRSCPHRHSAELAARTFCTFLRELSSLRRMFPTVFEELSGGRKRPMIRSMPTTGRPQQRYDHRLQHLVHCTGDVTIATGLGVPRSTARGWLGGAPTAVVCLDVALTTLIRLVLAVLRTSGFRLTEERLPDGRDKMRILRAVDRARAFVPLRTLLRCLRVSPSRFHARRRRQQTCALDDQFVLSPHIRSSTWAFAFSTPASANTTGVVSEGVAARLASSSTVTLLNGGECVGDSPRQDASREVVDHGMEVGAGPVEQANDGGVEPI
jgi:hypothetical protein